LQPVPASGVSRLDKGLALPLPNDPLYAPFVGAFWMSLVAPFLARGDFELALFVLRREPDGGSELCIGFAGGSPATLQAIFDVDKRDEAFVEVVAADWADEHADDDYAIKKLSSYLMQPQLSMSQAMRTFKECFLGE
jgi:type VI secretion system protein ImpM